MTALEVDMNTRPARPQPSCWRCEDWGTLPPRNGEKPQPCPENCAASRKAQAR